MVAYFVLRNSVDDPEKRGVFSAVLGLLSFVNVPITFLATRVVPSGLHPVVLREGGMTPDMAAVVTICLVGMLLLAFALYRLRFGNERLKQRITCLEEARKESQPPATESFCLDMFEERSVR